MYTCETCHHLFDEPKLYGGEESEAMGCPKCGSDRFELIEEVELPKQVNPTEILSDLFNLMAKDIRDSHQSKTV